MTCPECAGPRLPDHPAGLVISHLATCTLGAAEDATKAADHERTATMRRYTRLATAAEVTLLASLGMTLPEGTTTVERITTGGAVVRRTWPNLVVAP